MNNYYTIFLDMDGCLTDFGSEDKSVFGGMTLADFEKVHGKGSAKSYYMNAGSDIWSNLKWLKGGRELWETSIRLFRRVCILSSAGTTDPTEGLPVIKGKIEWINKNIPKIPKENVFIVFGKHLKSQYSNPLSILVDDLPTTITEWNKKGGIGILHNYKTYQRTIEKLDEIANPISLGKIAKRLYR